jgi:hypothetical protein
MGKNTGYCWERQKGRDHWEDQDVDGWVILKWILEIERGWGVMDWNDVAQDGKNWRALVNTVINLLVP